MQLNQSSAAPTLPDGLILERGEEIIARASIRGAWLTGDSVFALTDRRCVADCKTGLFGGVQRFDFPLREVASVDVETGFSLLRFAVGWFAAAAPFVLLSFSIGGILLAIAGTLALMLIFPWILLASFSADIRIAVADGTTARCGVFIFSKPRAVRFAALANVEAAKASAPTPTAGAR